MKANYYSILFAIVMFLISVTCLWGADFDAEVRDIWLYPSDIEAGETGRVYAQFRNLSDPNGPYDGAATFDARIIVHKPSGSSSFVPIDNWEFDYYGHEINLGLDNYFFNEAGQYKVTAEIYDINGMGSGWDSIHLLGDKVKYFTLEFPPPSGDLVVTVKNQDGNTRSAAHVVRYWDGGSSHDEKITNSSGQCTWNDIPTGTYDFEAYYEGTNPFDTLGELWTATTKTINTGDNSLTLRRDWPYVESFRIFRVFPHNDNWEPTGSSEITIGTEFNLQATVRNKTSYSKNTRVRFLLDRNKSLAWDYDNTSSYIPISSNNARFYGTAFTPTKAGTYYKAIKTEVNPGGKTDTWDWVKAFKILDLPETPENNGTIDFSGIIWDKIDWNWNAGLQPLYSNNASLDSGQLVLKVTTGSGIGAQVNSERSDYSYGNYKALIKAAPETTSPEGVCSAFFYYWGDPEDEDIYQEIDVEILSKQRDRVNFTVHHNKGSQETFCCYVENPDKQYHWYEFRWTNSEVSFFIDNVLAQDFDTGQYAVVTNPGMIPNRAGNIIFNNWSGSGWVGEPPKDLGDLNMRVNSVSCIPQSISKATIYNAWWTNEVDEDGDGYVRQARLNWNPDVLGCSDSLSVYEKIYWKDKNSSTWNLVATTSLHTITNCSASDIQYRTYSCDNHNEYDWKIEIYRDGQSSPDYARDPFNDNDLNDYKMETASEDEPSPTIGRNPSSLTTTCQQGQNASSQSFEVWNSGSGTLDYSISDNANWLSVNPSSGSSTGEHDTITVNYNTSSKSAGTYNATITISAAGESNSPKTILVELTVNPLPITPTPSKTPTPTITPVPTPELIAFWSFSGDANDQSGNNHHGTPQGVSSTTDRFEKQDSAYYFNGSNADIIAEYSTLNLPGDGTFNVWVKTGTDTGKLEIYRRRPGAGNGWELSIYNGNAYFEVDTGSKQSLRGSKNVTDDKWHMITWLREGDIMSIYVDAIFDAQTFHSGSASVDSIAYIGSDMGSSSWFEGKIDDIMVYSRALSEEQIGSLFYTSTPSASPTASPTPTVILTPEFLVLESGDYNGDGTDDIAVFRPSTNRWIIRGITQCYFGSSSDIPVPGDYDGDGTTELCLYRSRNSSWIIRGITRLYFGAPSDMPIPGDYDGDGSTDLAIFRSGLWKIDEISRFYFGVADDHPVPGNYDEIPGKDAGIFRPSLGLWKIRGMTRIYFGGMGDLPVPGDYANDENWELSFFRPSLGLWKIRGVTRIYFGRETDWPLPANYDGISGDELGIFGKDSGRWAVRGITRFYFGRVGDIPVVR